MPYSWARLSWNPIEERKAMDERDYLERLKSAIEQCFAEPHRDFTPSITGSSGFRGPEHPQRVKVEIPFEGNRLPSFDDKLLVATLNADEWEGEPLYEEPSGALRGWKKATYHGRFDGRKLTLVLTVA
jgi:hypothetical protein